LKPLLELETWRVFDSHYLDTKGSKQENQDAALQAQHPESLVEFLGGDEGI
jgi:hypothetical protein